MYKEIKYIGMDGSEQIRIQKTNDDGSFTSFSLDDSNYQAYLAWLDEGNEPLPADEA